MIHVLAVNDPAVLTYADKRFGILEAWSKKSGHKIQFTILPWAEYTSALMETLKNRDGMYDIVMIAGHLWLQDYINQGFLRPLAGIKSMINTYGSYEDVLPQIRGEIERDGTPWMLPSFTDGHMVFYKKDKIQEVTGKLLPEVITASEYVDLVRSIGTHPVGRGKRFLAMKAHPSEIFLDWLPLFFEGGNHIFDEDLNPIFNTPKAIKALSDYISLKEFALPGVEAFGAA